ncbi:MAG: HIT domain-containing protein [Candidatus Eremiobacteraeota bacterium]|nr:HIT domain-containing protein [Candidatus Eremiobacteraeota bacterium]
MAVSGPDCIFCKIVAGEIPATFLHRDDDVVAIADVSPQAPTHLLVMPVRHVADIATLMEGSGAPLIESLLRVAARLGSRAAGFRLVINSGPEGGQTVGHLHVHVLGGRQMHWPPG